MRQYIWGNISRNRVLKKQKKSLTVRNTLGGHKGDTAIEQLQISSSSEVKAS